MAIDPKSIPARLFSCARSTLSKAAKTSVWLLSLMLPISFVVLILDYSGVLSIVADWLGPLFQGIGLSGTAPLVIITAATVNIYSAIVIIETLSLGIREVTILALMCVIAHNLPIETAIQRKTGSSIVAILSTRIIGAILGALILSAIMPGFAGTDIDLDPTGDAIEAMDDGLTVSHIAGSGLGGFVEDLPLLLRAWLGSSVRTSIKIVIILAGLLYLQSVLIEFHLIDRLKVLFGPFLRIFGLPVSTDFLWIVANTLGLSYGSAVLIEEVSSGRLGKRDADLLNRHIAISHSLLEDTFVFVAIGVNAFWITVPRVALAIASVWITRLFRRFRAGNTDLLS